MPEIPAFCRSCGAVFGSGIVADNVRGLTLRGNRSQCPFCGGMGDVPDGVFDVFDDVIRVVSAPDWTVERLRRLAERLTAAREEHATPEAVTQAVRREAPELESVFRRLLVPTDAGQFYGMLAVIISILLFLASQGGQASPMEIQRITDQAVARCIGTPPASRAQGTRSNAQAAGREKRVAPNRRKRPPKTYGKTKPRKRR